MSVDVKELGVSVRRICQHVRERLETVGDGSLTVSEIAAGWTDVFGGDVFKVKNSFELGEEDAHRWMVQYGLDTLDEHGYVITNGTTWRLKNPGGKIVLHGTTLERRKSDEDFAEDHQRTLEDYDWIERRDKQLRRAWTRLVEQPDCTFTLKVFGAQGGAPKTKTFSIHQKAQAFALWSFDEFEKLADRIVKAGIHRPITVLGSEIIDGRHRAAICEALDIPVRVEMLQESISEVEIGLKIFTLNEAQTAKEQNTAKLGMRAIDWVGDTATAVKQWCRDAYVGQSLDSDGKQMCATLRTISGVPNPSRFRGLRWEEVVLELAGLTGISARSLQSLTGAVKKIDAAGQDAEAFREEIRAGRFPDIKAVEDASKERTGGVAQPKKKAAPAPIIPAPAPEEPELEDMEEDDVEDPFDMLRGASSKPAPEAPKPLSRQKREVAPHPASLSASEMSKSANKRLGDAITDALLTQTHLRLGRFGGTVKKPTSLEELELRANEAIEHLKDVISLIHEIREQERAAS